MPLFGKKKDKKEEEKKAEAALGASYPRQNAGYPAQAYPQAQATAPPPYTPQVAPQGGVPYSPPPPYNYQPPPQQPMAPGYQYQQQGYYQQQRAPWNPGQGTTVVVSSGYDAGARFDGVAQPNIPPPPPGVAPNAAQLAAAQGNTVVVGQRPGDFWTGGSDGGYTVW